MSVSYVSKYDVYPSQAFECFNAEVYSVEEHFLNIKKASPYDSKRDQLIVVPKVNCNAAIHDIRPGDRVSVRYQSDEYIIEFRFLREDEGFLPLSYDANGRLTMNVGHSFLLQTDKGSVSIGAQGDVAIKGVTLAQDFTEHYRVVSPTIAFN